MSIRSAILRRMIDDYQAQRIAAAEYLKPAKQVAEETRTHGMSKVPPVLRDHVPALAFYNTLQKAILGESEPGSEDVSQLSSAEESSFFSGPRYKGFGLILAPFLAICSIFSCAVSFDPASLPCSRACHICSLDIGVFIK